MPKGVAIGVLGLATAVVFLMVGALVGLGFVLDVGPPIGVLCALTAWTIVWYSVRNGRPQLYRWRNYLIVLVISNWLGILTASALLGFIAMCAGVLLFVVPTPKEKLETRHKLPQ